MSKKEICFISLGLVLSLLGAAHAATNIEWTGGDPADHLWTSPDNWDRREVPDGDFAAFIRGAASVEETSPIIQEGMDFSVVYIIVNEGNSNFTAYLRMTGGTVNTQNFWIAWDAAAVGNVKGVFNMSGGTVTANNLAICQAARADGGGSGTFNLTGGTFSTQSMSIMSLGRINIAGGTLILNGDQLSAVQQYIDEGLIIAWDGDGTLDFDYDVTNEGQTTVKGIHKLNPYPAHGDTISPGDVELRWTLPDPCVPGESVPVDVYFTDDYEALSMFTDPASMQIVSKENVTSITVPVEMGKQYFWAVDTYIGSPDDPMFGPIFTFTVDNLPPKVDAGQDVITWLVEGVRTGDLDGSVTDDGFPETPTLQWTVVSEPNDPDSPDALIADPTAADTNIVLSALGEYVLQLEAFDGEYTGSDTVTINVYNDSCEAAQSLPDYVPLVGDLNGNCRVDEEDLALLEENWLRDNSLIEEWFTFSPNRYTYNGGTPDETWDHDNGSDAWDGTGIGEGMPGGVSALTEGDVTFLRIQDPGDPRDYGFSDPTNRKVYLTRQVNATLDGVHLEFRLRVATGAPLDDQYPNGGAGISPWPETGIGYNISHGGKGMIGIAEGGGTDNPMQISLSLAKAGEPGFETLPTDVLVTNSLGGTVPNEDTVDTGDPDSEANYLPIADATAWNTVVVDIVVGGAGTHVVTVSVNGGDAVSFDVTAGDACDEDGNYLAIGSAGTDDMTAFDIDYVVVDY